MCPGRHAAGVSHLHCHRHCPQHGTASGGPCFSAEQLHRNPTQSLRQHRSCFSLSSLSTIFTSAAMTAQQKDSHFELLRRALWDTCTVPRSTGPAAVCTGSHTAWAALPPSAGNLLRLPRLQNGQTILEGTQFFSPWLPAWE